MNESIIKDVDQTNRQNSYRIQAISHDSFQN